MEFKDKILFFLLVIKQLYTQSLNSKYIIKCEYFLKDDEDKIMTLDDDKLLSLGGPIGDRVQFGDYI